MENKSTSPESGKLTNESIGSESHSIIRHSDPNNNKLTYDSISSENNRKHHNLTHESIDSEIQSQPYEPIESENYSLAESTGSKRNDRTHELIDSENESLTFESIDPKVNNLTHEPNSPGKHNPTQTSVDSESQTQPPESCVAPG
eukprot:299187_1